MHIDDEFLHQALSELIGAQQAAFGLFAAALFEQIDAAQFKNDLEKMIDSRHASFHPAAVRMALGAIAAADAHLERTSRRTSGLSVASPDSAVRWDEP